MHSLLVKFWLFATICAYSPLLRAQTPPRVQPTYIRPAKGEPFLPFGAAITIDAGTDSGVSLTTHDWRGYDSVSIQVEVSAGSSTCRYVPVIAVKGNYTATQGAKSVYQPDRNALRVFAPLFSSGLHDAYEVKTITPWVFFSYTTLDRGSGTASCDYLIYTTPQPMRDEESPVHYATKIVKSLDTNATSMFATTFDQHTSLLQNNAAVVVYCSFESTVSSSSYAVALSAATAADNGTGGSWMLEDYAGPIYCVAASGSGNRVTGYRF